MLKILKPLLALMLLLTAVGAVAQSVVFYTDRALAVNPFSASGAGSTPSAIFMSFAWVRVCTLPLTLGTPCPTPASITNLFGSPITITGGNFGQLQTDVVGRFSFGCLPGLYQVQVASTGSNTPTLAYPITCPSGGTASTAGGLTGQVQVNNTINGLSGITVLYDDAFAGSDHSARIQAAINSASCSSAGCIIYALSPDAGGTGSTTIDPGSKQVTIYLGPNNYHFSSIVLRQGLQIFGQGATAPGTSITSMSTTNPPIVLGSGAPAAEVRLEGFILYGPGHTDGTGCTNQTPSAVTDGILLDSNISATAGLWYSQFQNLIICGFSGIGLHIKGTTGSGGVSQFDTYTNVVVYRAVGGNSALKMEGATYQQLFVNDEFDANCLNTCIDNTTTPNIFMGGVSGGTTSSFPFIVAFDGLTSQGAKTLVQLDGGANYYFLHSHHEAACIGYLVTYGASGTNIPTDNLVIDKTSFNGNVGYGTASTSPVGTCGGAGQGAILKTTTAFVRGLTFSNSVQRTASGSNCADNFIWNTVDPGPEVVATNNELSCTGNWNGVAQPGQMFTQGNTPVITAASTIVTGTSHAIVVSGVTQITNISSTLTSGEVLTIIANTSVVLATGGNLRLNGHTNVFLNPGDTITFTVQDSLTGALQMTAIDDGPDGGMFKHKRFGATCSTTNVAGNTCTSTFSWTTPFADANYTPVCFGVAPTGSPILTLSVNQIAASITVQVQAATGAISNFGGVDCIANHD